MDVPPTPTGGADFRANVYTVKDEPAVAGDAATCGTCARCHRFTWHCVCSPTLGSYPDDARARQRTPELGVPSNPGSADEMEEGSDDVDEEPEGPNSPPTRGRQAPVAGKRPRGYLPDEDDPVPDLADYFSQWPEMSMEDIIAMCRTHANALQRRVNFLKKRRLANTIARSTGNVPRGATASRRLGGAKGSKTSSK